ncbi:MAG: ADP-glyceromanno-heptose 6-epimerase, partial [Desulfobacterales bacterium]
MVTLASHQRPLVVITGGGGFIGSNIAARLSPLGDVVVCDRFGSDDRWRNIAKHGIADILAPEQLFEFLKAHAQEVEVVIHMGAVSATTEQNVDYILQNNFALSRDLWRWCSQARCRFIYASSAATYGNGAFGFQDDEDPRALARLRPLNAYGWSKHLFDRHVMRVLHGSGPHPRQWAGLKFFNVYGPNEYHKGSMKSVAAHIYPQAAAGRAVQLFRSHHPDFPDGGQLRDFIYVDDCVAVVVWLLQNPSVNGLFNVGTGRARTFADLARAVFA